MNRAADQLLPALNYGGPLACAECGGPARQPAAGVARVEQRGRYGWRICRECDREVAAWRSRGRSANPLAELVAVRRDLVAALVVRDVMRQPYRVLTPYSEVPGTLPVDDPALRRWHHIPDGLLDRIVDQALTVRWTVSA
ncbi:hypothetical protein [Streptomyces sp. NPDC089799]|uniref:hypothetical protein n=1 Tax=Streptomyces sp. NPDC089799 TaxID=3155066 RepID=UPI0034256313